MLSTEITLFLTMLSTKDNALLSAEENTYSHIDIYQRNALLSTEDIYTPKITLIHALLSTEINTYSHIAI